MDGAKTLDLYRTAGLSKESASQGVPTKFKGQLVGRCEGKLSKAGQNPARLLSR